ncbi:uncharacterized protein LOC123315704 [Coccinella septempunctata]|uniref:uncharacterized protein LOC123315704 n=1 Tax=Coccinella septempunctata TaxID=41139 RepID=UPI001D077925|nr:uncharacterized protein LOC123315704 [Coccinella septempunctata]
MKGQCVLCQKTINDVKHPGLQCSSCNKSYHANNVCSDVNKQQLSLIDTLPGTLWFCRGCRDSTESPPRLPNTRSRTGAQPVSRDAGYSAEDVDHSSTPPNTDLLSLRDEIRDMKRSVDFCSDKISDFEGVVSRFNNLLKLTQELKAENADLKLEISSLNHRLNSMEQHTKSNNIEIQDVPEKTGENLFQIIDKIGNFIGQPIKKENVDFITRVNTKIASKPKHIVVRFTTKLLRDEFLAKAKIKRNQCENRSLMLDGISNRFFINEHLTIANKILLRKVRDVSKERNFKFVWVRDGAILARKDERSKIIQISSESDIAKIK